MLHHLTFGLCVNKEPRVKTEVDSKVFVLHHLTLGSAVIRSRLKWMRKCWWVLHHLTFGSAVIKGQVSMMKWMRKCRWVLHHLTFGHCGNKVPRVKAETDGEV